MVTLENLTKQYADFVAIENLNAEIQNASIYGLVGFNGAGKTTLLKTIAGIYRPEQGRVCIDGENVFENERLKSGIFLLSDDLYFLPQASLHEMARFYKGYFPAWSEKTFTKITALFGLDPAARINGFSKGMQRQAGMVLALSTLPHTLLLDEAFDGLDLAKRNLLARVLREFVAEKHAVVIVASHNLRELEGLVDHLGVIRDRCFFFNNSLEAMRQQRGKFHAVFGERPKVQRLKQLPLAMLQTEENGCTFLYGGEETALRTLLEPFAPRLIERLPMTLEEFFMEQKEDPEDAYTDLF